MTAAQAPIAIVGIAALFPGSTDKAGFWRDIVAGKDLVTDVPASHWRIDDYYDPDPRARDKTYSRRGAFLPPVAFDPVAWGVPPANVPATDTTQLLALIVAQQVLEDAAGTRWKDLPRDRISVILGCTSAQELLGSMVSRLQRPVWAKALREQGLPEAAVIEACDRIASHYVEWQESTFPGVLGNVVAGRIANRLDLGGTNCVTDAACASSLSALAMAVAELRLGASDLVITGGADTMNDIFMYVCFSKTPALSPTGDCRPFSDRADGTLLGEGIGMVALKRLADAERAGDAIYGVIKGVGSSSDGRAKSVYAPVSDGQAAALRRAYAQAGYGPDTVTLVEAHGTGTKAGDVAEFEGLRRVFGETGRRDDGWCALGSVKSQIGHTKAAAGAAGLFKVAMALAHKVLPPTLKVERPDPKLGIETSPFYLNTVARPWIADPRAPRRASVSSFGFGGSNFHVTIEEYTGPAPRAARTRPAGVEAVLVAGDAPDSVAAQCRALAASANQPGMLARLAHTTQIAFAAAAPVRLAVFADSEAELATRLGKAADIAARGEPATIPGVLAFARDRGGDVAFVFPGQGSQYVDMAGDVAMAYDAAREVWDGARAIDLAGGEHLDEVVYPRPVFDDAGRAAQRARLTATEWAQPAIGATSLALLALLRAAGVEPAAVAGHSFGELSALCAAGALSADDLLRVARRRGELMAEVAAVPGAMTSVTGRLDDVRRATAGTGVVIANHNAPQQVVLSGATTEIAEIESRLASQGMACTRLPVATAFHSPVVSAARAPFRAALDGVDLRAPTIDIYGNASAAPYPREPAAIRDTLARQLVEPVRFVEQIEAMYARGIRVFVEVGPGAVLTGLIRQILELRPHAAIAMNRKGRPGLAALHEALGTLSVAGVAIDYASLWASFATPVDPRTRAKPAMTMELTGTCFGKLYPPRDPATRPTELTDGTRTISTARPMPITQAAQPAPGAQPSSAPNAPPAPAPNAQPVSPSSSESEPSRGAEQTARASTPLASPPRSARGSSPPPLSAVAQSSATASKVFVMPTPPTPHEIRDARSMAAPTTAEPLEARPIWLDTDRSVQLAWVQAFQDAQRHTAEAHVAFQRAMAEGHAQFLRSTESAMNSLVAIVTGAPPPSMHATATEVARALPAPVPIAPMPAITPMWPAPESVHDASPALPATPVSRPPLTPAWAPLTASEPLPVIKPRSAASELDTVAPVHAAPVHAAPVHAAPVHAAPVHAAPVHAAPVHAAPVHAAPVHAAAPAVPTEDTRPAAWTIAELQPIALAVVAACTGYPEDMLGLDMDLESDLGVDSIKRVEILAALAEKAPGLPEVPGAELAPKRTLRQILAHFEAVLNPGPPDSPGGGGGSRSASDAGAPTAASAPVSSIAERPARSAVRAVDAPADGLGVPGLLDARRVAITDDGGGVAAALAARFAAVGTPASVVSEVPADADAVISLEGLGAGRDPPAAIALLRAAFHAARAVAARFADTGGVFITVQDTGGSFGLEGSERAWLGGIAGLAKTAALEWPQAQVRAIDVECGGRSPDEVAGAVWRELLEGDARREVGLRRDGRRVGLELLDAARDPATDRGPRTTPVIAPGAVVIASGGGRGVTAACLIALAGATRGRFVLLGRSALVDEPAECRGIVLPFDSAAGRGHGSAGEADAALKRALLADARQRGLSLTPLELGRRAAAVRAAREVQHTIAAIRAAGGDARYEVADVADEAAVARAVAAARAWGPIAGIVHGAGVLADKRIADKTDAQLDAVLAPKLLGLHGLLEATRSDDLGFIALFSSLAGRLGNPGQADYAMANEVLNKVAALEQRRRGPGCTVRAIGWGPWDGGMVDDGLRAHFAARAVPLLSLAAGAHQLCDELAAPHRHEPEIVVGDFAPGRAAPRCTATTAFANLGHAASTTVAADSFARDIVVERARHGFLDGHRIKGVPVLPIALAVEWFARAAALGLPDAAAIALRRLRVLRGVRLTGFDAGRADRFVVSARRPASSVAMASLALELVGSDHTRHYTAIAEPVRGAPDRRVAALGPLTPWAGAIYGPHGLFHGDGFRAIERVDGVSPRGMSARVHGAAHLAWPGTWRVDPALLDGGLQLALLWTRHALGRAALPTAIDQLELHVAGPVRGAVHCVLEARQSARDRAACDLVFVDQDGRVIARMYGVETHALPGESAGDPYEQAG